jgi:ubiquinol-cytochrome c reductase cytochrome c subunit
VVFAAVVAAFEMMKHKSFLGLGLLVGGLLLGAGTSDGAPAATPAPTVSAAAGDARAGKDTFTEYCSICHGVAAQGFIGPHIGGIDWTAPGLRAIVRGGLGGYGGMPAFNANAVTDKNIADIAAYLASLASATSAPSSTVAATQAPATVSSSPPVAAAPLASVPASAAAVASAPVASARPVALAATGDPVHGRQIFTANCAACHGAAAQGGVGPSLRGESTRKNTAAAIAWIKNPKLPMPKLYPNPLSQKDVEDVAAYIESL